LISGFVEKHSSRLVEFRIMALTRGTEDLYGSALNWDAKTDLIDYRRHGLVPVKSRREEGFVVGTTCEEYDFLVRLEDGEDDAMDYDEQEEIASNLLGKWDQLQVLVEANRKAVGFGKGRHPLVRQTKSKYFL
jgi:hypothetical protein